MNEYGRRLQTHWQDNLPTQYAQLPDPETFFTEMGEQTAHQIDSLADQLIAQAPQQENYWQRVARLNEAIFQAEELVLRPQLLEPTS